MSHLVASARRKPALSPIPIKPVRELAHHGVHPLICPLMDGETHKCDDWCEEHTGVESRWEVFSPQRWAVAERQRGELWSLASVIIPLSYRPPPPPPICTHYTAKPWHTIPPYALPLRSACSRSLTHFVLSLTLSSWCLHTLAIFYFPVPDNLCCYSSSQQTVVSPAVQHNIEQNKRAVKVGVLHMTTGD